MTDRPILFVAGLGRCGMTMVMNMLWRGGFPVSGPPPAFEPVEMSLTSMNKDWVRAQFGRAVKWVDPLHARLTPWDLSVPPVMIHLTRGSREQARSQIKLLAQTGLPIPTDRRAIRAMAKSIRADTPKVDRMLDGLGTCYHMSFEWILLYPDQAAAKLAAIAMKEFATRIDIAAARSVVISRPPECAPDLAIEMAYDA